MRVVFMGTPEFAVPSLSEIVSAGHEVICVYTQPPRPAGRGQSLTKSPVHIFAELMGLDVRTPERFTKPSVIDEFEALGADVACVVAYGQILPQRALCAPREGCLNLHASLLPRWRGAAPIQRAIMAGDTQTAAQIMKMAKGLDTGDVVMSASVPIGPDVTAGALHDTLSQTGAQLWPPVLAALARGGLMGTAQQGEPSYAQKIDKAEARIDWSKTAREISCLIRGLSPFPGAWCEIAQKRVKIHAAHILEPGLNTEAVLHTVPGTVLDDQLTIACGSGALRLTAVQPAGKAEMSAADFLRGHDVPAGTVLP